MIRPCLNDSKWKISSTYLFGPQGTIINFVNIRKGDGKKMKKGNEVIGHWEYINEKESLPNRVFLHDVISAECSNQSKFVGIVTCQNHNGMM